VLTLKGRGIEVSGISESRCSLRTTSLKELMRMSLQEDTDREEVSSLLEKEWLELSVQFLCASSNAFGVMMQLMNHYVKDCDPRSTNAQKYRKCVVYYQDKVYDKRDILRFKNVDHRLEALAIMLDGLCFVLEDCLTGQCKNVIVKSQ
jgi:hypothetical protein